MERKLWERNELSMNPHLYIPTFMSQGIFIIILDMYYYIFLSSKVQNTKVRLINVEVNIKCGFDLTFENQF